MTEVVVITEDIRHAKLQSNRHHQQTNTQLLTGRMLFPSPTNSVGTLKRNSYNYFSQLFMLIDNWGKRNVLALHIAASLPKQSCFRLMLV